MEVNHSRRLDRVGEVARLGARERVREECVGIRVCVECNAQFEYVSEKKDRKQAERKQKTDNKQMPERRPQ